MKRTTILAAVLAALMLVSMYPMFSPVASPNGPRSDIEIIWYANSFYAWQDLAWDEIDLLDCVLDWNEFLYSEDDPDIQLNPVRVPSPRTDRYKKGELPDLGQHSDKWCWDAALANALVWFSQHGYPSLVPSLCYQIDPNSLDPNDWHWYCPGGEGYMTLLKKIAIATPNLHDDRDGDGAIGEDWIDGLDNDWNNGVDEDPPHRLFCEAAYQDEYNCAFDNLIRNGPYKYVLNWTIIHYPSFADYMVHLSGGEGVILWLDLPDGDHAVTGASFDNTTQKTIGISDPWTPDQPDHNNDLRPLRWRYDECNVTQENPLRILYDGENISVAKMYCIFPIGAVKAYRKEVAGTVSVDDAWTFLNAYRAQNDPGDPLRLGAVYEVVDPLNILYSQWHHEYAFLDRVYTYLINVNPYDLVTDIPWVAQDWEVGTWIDPRDGSTNSVVTYWLRKDVGCVAPVTGDFAGFFSAYDYDFTVWYNYAYDDSWQWPHFADVHHTQIVDGHTVKVYFDDLDPWLVYAPIGPLLGPAPILVDQLCDETCTTFTGADLVEDPPSYFECQFTLDQVVGVINATCNGAPIYEGVDFYIRAGYDVFCHNIFVPLRSFDPGDIITICYYKAIPGGAGGTYLGGNLGYDWTDTMFAYGTHYPISISGTSAALNKNPYFFLETPLLGELDWRWYWTGTTKPRSGYFKIDILDVVKCTAAYSSRGDGIYNPSWFPGADLDSNDLCHVGILDLVTVTGKYAQTFGTPPTTTIGVVGGTTTMTADEVYVNPNPIQFNDTVVPIRNSYEEICVMNVPPVSGSANIPCIIGASQITISKRHEDDTVTLNPATGDVTFTLNHPNSYIWITYHKPTCQWEMLKIYN